MVCDILNIIRNCGSNSNECLADIKKYINSYSCFSDILQYISIIPESIPHDSTKEKLWAKASDIALSCAFQRLGMKSTVLQARADSADVVTKSIYHNYTLVADAKAFRLSRTAKNQKDFKVVSLSNWRQDSDYAVLCSPYFHYPFNKSQIYQQAIQHNVCLLSWEHLIFLINNKIKESEKIDFSNIWSYSKIYGKIVKFSDMKNCFLNNFNEFICDLYKISYSNFKEFLNCQIPVIKNLGDIGISYLQSELNKILNYTRDEAIKELIKTKKINKKIDRITSFIAGLPDGI